MKVRIFQPIVPEYRRALFDGVAARYGDSIELYSAESFGNDVSVPLAKMRHDYSHSFVRIGPFVWQKGFTTSGLSRGDVIIICGDLHQLSSLWLALVAKFRGIKVVWWGHHKTATSSRISVFIRLKIARWFSDIMLVYTRTGREFLIERGFEKESVFALGNTIDQGPIRNAIARYDGIDPFKGHPGILCCSVLREKVRLDMAIRALKDERLHNVMLAVIGTGPMEAIYHRLADELGVASRIVWIGATRNQDEMAPWFLSARAFVYPGSIGLSVLHAMSYGLPVVVHDNPNHQMPEYEVVEDGNTGLCFAENDVKDLSDKIYRIVSDGDLRMRLSERSTILAYSVYTMQKMIDNFSASIEAVRNL